MSADDYGLSHEQHAKLVAAARRWHFAHIPTTDAGLAQLVEYINLDADMAALHRQLVQQHCDRAIKAAEAESRSIDDWLAAAVLRLELHANGEADQ